MSWKSFGGISQLSTSNVNVTTITANDIILRKAYAGDFAIAGSIIVNTDAEITGNLVVGKSSTLNDVSMTSLNVSSKAVFRGDVSMNQTLSANNISSNTIQTSGDVTLGSHLYLNTPHYFYGTSQGIGLDRTDPKATLDICSNQISSLNVGTSTNTNKNILAKNGLNNGVVIGASGSQSSIDFFTTNDISINTYGDSYIHCDNSGMILEAPLNIKCLSNMVISGSNHANTEHISNETLTLYDNIQTGSYYFPDVYRLKFKDENQNIYQLKTNLGKNTAFSSCDTTKNAVSMISLTNHEGYGAGFVAGNYPTFQQNQENGPKNSMFSYGLMDKSGNYMPTETVVYGSPTNTKYLATTGINTYRPRTDQYVLDINGPVHVDNGDIINVNNTAFEILKMKQAMYTKKYIMAIGASIDVSGSYIYSTGQNTKIGYRYSVLFSSNGGVTWNSSTLFPNDDLDNSNNAVVSGNIINQLAVYDSNYAFITGNNNMISYTYNGGITWQRINTIDTSNVRIQTADYNAISIYDLSNNSNSLRVYLSVDISGSYSKITSFDVSFSDLTGIKPSGQTITKQIRLYSSTTKIQYMDSATSKLYVTGNKILVYDISTILTSPHYSYGPIASTFESNYYIWSKIHVYSDTYAIAIGNALNVANGGAGGSYSSNVSIISTIKNFTMNTLYTYTATDPLNSLFGTVSTYDSVDETSIFYYPMDCIIKDVYIQDPSNVIVIGNCKELIIDDGVLTSTHEVGGFILVSYDSGTTWSDISVPLLNASGKSNLLLGTPNILHNITIPDTNTLLIAYSIVPSVVDPSNNYITTGQSGIYSCFTPNYLNAANNHVMDICGNVSIYGSLFATSLTCNSFTNLSDYRIKQDVCLIDDLSIDSLRPVQYTNTLNGKCELGFVAHELQEHLPMLVEGEKDGANYQSVNYTGIIALLVKEIQVLKKEIENLKNK